MSPLFVVVPPPPPSGAHMLHERPVGCRLDGDGLLHQSIKQFPAMPGGPPVEPERELVEVVVQMRVSNGALMRAEEPSFEQGDDQMNAGQQGAGRFGMVREKRDAMSVSMALHAVVSTSCGKTLDLWTTMRSTADRPLGSSAHRATRPRKSTLGVPADRRVN